MNPWQTRIAGPLFRTARHEAGTPEGWNDSILDLIFIQGIPRRQEFRAIKHSLSFDGFAVRNAKGEPITADDAVVRLHAVTPVAHFKARLPSRRLRTEASPLPSTASPAPLPPVGRAHLSLVSELFRIIIFVSERHPRGSKLKLSFLAIARRREPSRFSRRRRAELSF